jgi:hypothetical protein
MTRFLKLFHESTGIFFLIAAPDEKIIVNLIYMMEIAIFMPEKGIHIFLLFHAN